MRRWWWIGVLAALAAAGVFHEVWWSRKFDDQSQEFRW